MATRGNHGAHNLVTARQFPDIWYEHGYTWRMGFLSGKWRATERDKVPPSGNPMVPGTAEWREWQDGFKAGSEWRKLEKGE